MAWGKGAMQRYLDERADRQPVRTRCLFCGWKYRGKVSEARERALEHRRLEHPETLKRKRRVMA